MAHFSPITTARFWSKVAVQPSQSKCWNWRASLDPAGYGKFRVSDGGRRIIGAHRVAFQLANPTLPLEGLVIRHQCDNPKCCNPAHLDSGSVNDNIQDMVRRGRTRCGDQVGQKNSCAKLTGADVEIIREMISNGETNTKIGSHFGVTHSAISAIKLGKSWASGSNEPSGEKNKTENCND